MSGRTNQARKWPILGKVALSLGSENELGINARLKGAVDRA